MVRRDFLGSIHAMFTCKSHVICTHPVALQVLSNALIETSYYTNRRPGPDNYFTERHYNYLSLWTELAEANIASPGQSGCRL